MAILTRGMATCALLMATLVATGCGELSSPMVFSEERVAVHGVVFAGSYDVAVLVSRIPVPETGQEIRYEGVEDAVVEVVVAGIPIRLDHRHLTDACVIGMDGGLGTFTGAGCYSARLDQPIAAGAIVDLAISLPDGTRITGSATVPEPVKLHAPEPAARIVAAVTDQGAAGQGTLDLAWSAAPEVARLEVTAFATRAGCGVGIGNTHPQVNFVLIRNVPGGGARIPFTYVDCPGSTTWDSFPALVRVTAYDSLYARYSDDVLTASAVRLDRASAGLRGALGLFIGAASVDRPVTMVSP
jgi:hypothetical protein